MALTEVANRLNRVRIPRSLTPIGPNQYEICPHWWAWWLPHNTGLTWEFIDVNNNIVTATSTYGTNPVVITTTTPVPDLFLYVPVIPARLCYFSELDVIVHKADRPTLFLLIESEIKFDKFRWVTSAFQGLLFIPTKTNIDPALHQQIHDGMLEAVREYFIHALLEIERAEFIANYTENRGVGKAGQRLLSAQGTALLLTFSFAHYVS